MPKKMRAVLAVGIILLISGLILAFTHVAPGIVPALIASIGGAMIGVYFSTRGGTLVLDEMVKRVNALSAYYSWISTFYCITALSFIQFFRPNLLNGWQLWIVLIVMSWSFIVFRYVFLKRGRTE
jgi:hypothetical protein